GLISCETADVERRPIHRVADDGAVAARDLGEVVPVASVPIERDVAVGDEKIQRAVVVEVAELCPETPATELDAELAGEVLVFQRVAYGSFLGHPKVVALNENAFLGDVGHIDSVSSTIEYVAECDVHSALGREADARLGADLTETRPVVEVELGHAVVVGDEEIGAACAAKIRRAGRERPAPRGHSRRPAAFLELA